MTMQQLDAGGGFTAAADYSSIGPYVAVTVDATGRTVSTVNAATEPILGIMQNNPKASEPASIVVAGVSWVVGGGAIVRGDKLKVDTADAGKVIPFVEGTDGHDHGAAPGVGDSPVASTFVYIVGTALQDAADGDIFAMLVRPQAF